MIDQIKAETPVIIQKYTHRSNVKATIQCLNTLIPYLALFYLAMTSMESSYGLFVLYISALSLFIVRIFMLMHDCGHKSLFRTRWLNTVIGFITGVIVGMPQYVWAKHHSYHHATNGNWEKYRGPLNILSVAEYEKMTPGKQKSYRYGRNIFLAPLGGFMYFIFNPRVNWMLGSIRFILDIPVTKLSNWKLPVKEIVAGYETKYWKTTAEYWHMTLNNIVLLGIWGMASWYFGAAAFFTVYLISLSLAGAAGIIIFTIQHNFEGSHACDDSNWDYHNAALKGTSFLTFPKFINWFGADIAYHHIHHISSRIPNYNLAECHKEYAHLFEEVKRIRLSNIANAFKHILWDTNSQRIITMVEYNKANIATG